MMMMMMMMTEIEPEEAELRWGRIINIDSIGDTEKALCNSKGVTFQTCIWSKKDRAQRPSLMWLRASWPHKKGDQRRLAEPTQRHVGWSRPHTHGRRSSV